MKSNKRGGAMLKIFLAEDEVIVRETIKRMIPWEELGFELVGEAADGEMALPLLIRQKPVESRVVALLVCTNNYDRL